MQLVTVIDIRIQTLQLMVYRNEKNRLADFNETSRTFSIILDRALFFKHKRVIRVTEMLDIKEQFVGIVDCSETVSAAVWPVKLTHCSTELS